MAVTAYDDAVQAARDAMWVTEHFPVNENDVRLPSCDHPDFVQMEVMTYVSPEAAVAAAWPHITEAVARAIEARREGVTDKTESGRDVLRGLNTAARIARNVKPEARS